MTAEELRRKLGSFGKSGKSGKSSLLLKVSTALSTR
jgi:hypothetical protein